MFGSRTAHGLAPAALLGGAVAFIAALSTLLENAARVAEPLRGFDHVHVALATAFLPLAFAVLTAAWLYVWRVLHERLLRGEPTRRAAVLRRIALSLPILGLPGYAVAFLLTNGTSAFRPGRTEWQLAALVVIAAPAALLGFELAGRGVRRLRLLGERAVFAMFVALALAAFAIWFVTTAALRERYGASQLLSFGLLTAGTTLLFSAFFAAAERRADLELRATAALMGALASAAVALLAPAASAVVAHFHADRPSRWFARALSPALPDRDGDGSPADIGLLSGGDCDDADSKRHPFARDVPQNGLDENCFQGDAAATNDAAAALRPVAVRDSLPAPPTNVVLVVIDSLRFDRRFENGIDPKVMPALAQLTRTSTTFSAFRTCSPRTRESVPDLLGATPELFASSSPMPPNAIEALARSGVRTAFIASEWLARYASVPGFELARLEPSRYGHFADAEVAEGARAFLRERRDRRPFFLFTHWLGAHEPYAGDADCLTRATSDRERYDCALTTLDRELAALLVSLTETRLDERTVLAVTADHGEEFGEHGGRFHATTLYDEILRVPLVIRAPGRTAELVGAPVGCGDLMPTLLRLAGHDPGLAPYGRDVLARGRRSTPQLARTRRPGAPAFEPKAHAVVHRDHKLLFDAASGVATYFDLARDPFEQRPLASVPPAIRRELLAAMDSWLSAQAPGGSAERSPVLAAR